MLKDATNLHLPLSGFTVVYFGGGWLLFFRIHTVFKRTNVKAILWGLWNPDNPVPMASRGLVLRHPSPALSSPPWPTRLSTVGFLGAWSITDLQRIDAYLRRAFPATFTPTYVCNLQGRHKQISRPHDCAWELKITCPSEYITFRMQNAVC